MNALQRSTVMALALISSSASADENSDWQVREVNLKRGVGVDPHKGHSYYVVFLARETDLSGYDIGHIWVSWIDKDPSGKVAENANYGFYPGDGDKKEACAFGCPPKLQSEMVLLEPTDELPTGIRRIIVSVDWDKYNESKKIFNEWAKRDPESLYSGEKEPARPGDRYDLLTNSCKNFATEVAIALKGDGLTTFKADLPTTHLERIFEFLTYGAENE